MANRAELQRQIASFIVTQKDGDEQEFQLQMITPIVRDIEITPPVIAHTYSSLDSGSKEFNLTIRRHVKKGRPPGVGPEFSGLRKEIRLVDIKKTDVRELQPGLWLEEWKSTYTISCPQDESGGKQQGFNVSFSDTRSLMCYVPVTLDLSSGIRVLPKELHFGIVERGLKHKRKLILSSADESAFQVIRIHNSSQVFNVDADDSDSKKNHWLEILFLADQPGRFSDFITVETDHPLARQITFKIDAQSR